MTVWYAQNSSVNIDAANVWNDAADGSGSWLTWPPDAGDTLRANGYTAIDCNVNFTVAQIDTLTSGGGFTVSAARTITTNVPAGTTHCITASHTTGTVTINGTVTGSGVTSGKFGLIHSGNGGAIVIVGDITGGAANGAAGVSLTVANESLTVTGTITGGSGLSSGGISSTLSTHTITVNGDVVGGSNTGASGIYGGTTQGPVVVVNNGNLIDTASALAIHRYITSLDYNPGASNYIQMSDGTKYPVQLTAGNIRKGVVHGDVTGTLSRKRKARFMGV